MLLVTLQNYLMLNLTLYCTVQYLIHGTEKSKCGILSLHTTLSYASPNILAITCPGLR